MKNTINDYASKEGYDFFDIRITSYGEGVFLDSPEFEKENIGQKMDDGDTVKITFLCEGKLFVSYMYFDGDMLIDDDEHDNDDEEFEHFNWVEYIDKLVNIKVEYL